MTGWGDNSLKGLLMSDRKPRFELLREQIESCSGNRVVQDLRVFKVSYYTFVANHKQLKTAIQAATGPDKVLEILSGKNRGGFEPYQLEISRLLHNFLAAAVSLTQHAKKLVTEKEEGLKKQYLNKKKEFLEQPLPQFVDQLRHYALHKRLPFLTSNVEMKRRDAGKFGVSASVSLSIQNLREARVWSKKATSFLEGQKEDALPLDVVADRYLKAVRGFYRWLIGAIKDAHREHLNELRSLKAEFQKEWQKYSSNIPEE